MIRLIKHPTLLLIKLDQIGAIRLSDEAILRMEYKQFFKKELDLDNPQTFNEKLQWLKLHDRNPMYTQMVDKFAVKRYVANKIGEEYIIPTLGVYDNFDEINFDELPDKFVIKCTHDSGGLVVVRDKNTFDKNAARKKIATCLKKNFYYESREWPYKNVKPKVIIEKYMEDKNQRELKDYKFYCFDGVPKYLYVSEGLENHQTARIEFFDMEFKPAPFSRSDYKKFDVKPEKPLNFEKMKKLAGVLSKDMSFLRVDFYEINGKIYFGELTFTPCGGFMPFQPEIWDKKLGDMLVLPEKGRGDA